MIYLIIYLLLTTIYGVYWLVKHPSERTGNDMEYFTLLDVFAYSFLSIIFAPFFVPMILLSNFKFKRNK